MQEIAPHIFIETSYPGVTLGAISWPHGLILVDAPYRPDDVRQWRSVLLNMSGGVDRLLVNLDAHYDRTLGTRLMDCAVCGQEKMAQIFRDRPVAFKPQAAESGAEWELTNGLGSVRWAPPEITFSDSMNLYWDGNPMHLQHRPGPAPEAIWVDLPNDRVLFVGDAVTPNFPPFLAYADLPEWLKILDLLLSPSYQEYMIVSGRGGVVFREDIRRQYDYLVHAGQILSEAIENRRGAEQLESAVPDLLSSFDIPADKLEHYTTRLKWGLQHYYAAHSHPRNPVTYE
jgi:glyoxylase-like metal-dependent hydrolase (beta-lactamase superfamily II)